MKVIDRSAANILSLCACLGGVVSVAACATSAGGGDGVARVTQVVSEREVVLQPTLEAGEGGWCLTVVGTVGCPTLDMPTLGAPIIIENWTGESSSFKGPVRDGIALTTEGVAAVSFEGRLPVATHAQPGLPDHLRSVLVELRGGTGLRVLGGNAGQALPRAHFKALNSKNEPLLQSRTPGATLEFHLPSQNLGAAQVAQKGACRIVAKNVSGLLYEGGRVMMAVRSHRDMYGKEFVSCIRTSYLFDNWPLTTVVLLDAAHPGTTPASLPTFHRLAGHAGIFEGFTLEGEAVARRISQAWLIVTKGQGLGQRLTLLEHLRAKIHLEGKR
jgi:hypothetical protein